MRAVLGFFSMLAFGLLAAGLIAVVGTGPGARLSAFDFNSGGNGFDVGTLAVGIALGFALSVLGRIPWYEIPRRFIAWIIANERNFYRFAWAGVLVAILIFY